MNITYLIGNGFDLGLGLKTKFSDFLVSYIKIKNDNEFIKIFKSDIQKEGIENWSDFELKLGEYTAKLNESDMDNFLYLLQDFEEQFMDYLKSIESELDFKTEQIREIADGLYWFDKDKVLRKTAEDRIKSLNTRNSLLNFNFINYNYTSTLWKVLDQIKKEGFLKKKKTIVSLDKGYELKSDTIKECIHVHGSINESPIIGVNDESQILNKQFAQNEDIRSIFIKHEHDKISQRGYEEDASKVLFGSDIVCVYGMSIGYTDKLWWDKLIQFLSLDVKNQIVFFIWDDKNIDNDYNWGKQRRKLFKKIAGLTGEEELDSYYGDRIHFVIHKNIFEIKNKSLSEKFFDKMNEESYQQKAE